MKRITVSLIAILILVGSSMNRFAYGNLDEKSLVTESNVDGLQVISKKAFNDIISVQLFIRGGTAYYTKEQEGIEALTLGVVTHGGTMTQPKDDFQSELEKLGTTIGGNSGLDFSTITMKCIKKNWARSWEMLTDIILNPDIEEATFLLNKDNAISAIKQDDSSPDARLEEMSRDASFQDHFYSIKPNGSEASLEKLQLEDIRNYYSTLINKSRCFLVVVGNLDGKELELRVKESLAKMPEGRFATKTFNRLNITKSSVVFEERDIATNYIQGTIGAPLPLTDENRAMIVAMAILYDRYFEEIRTKRGLSYSPQSYLRNRRTPSAIIYVTTIEPDAAVQVMIDELKKIKKDGFEDSELKNKKAGFLTRHYMQLETNDSQGDMLGRAEILGGWEKTETFVDDINALTLEDINDTFDKYVKGVNWVYLGQKDQFNEATYLQSLN